MTGAGTVSLPKIWRRVLFAWALRLGKYVLNDMIIFHQRPTSHGHSVLRDLLRDITGAKKDTYIQVVEFNEPDVTN